MRFRKFKISSNQNGFAVVMGLLVLLIVTIAGMSLLLLAQKDKSAAVDSSSIRNVALAAEAALTACESQFTLKPDIVVAIFNKYTNNKDFKWLLVSDASLSATEKKISFGTDGLEYSACITAYDVQNQVVQIKGTGYGRGNAQKSITGIYKLSGLKSANGGTGKYGLYLAGDGRNFDTKIDITGDVFFGKDFHFNGGADSSAIHGMLKTGVDKTLQSSFDASGVVIDSAVYIGTGLSLKHPVTFNYKTGIEGALVLDYILTFKNDAWINDTNSGNSSIDMSGKKIHHSGHVNMLKVVNGTEDNTNGFISDIADKVGVGSTNDSAWGMDISTLTGKAQYIEGSIDAGELQTMFDHCSAFNKVNGYMVVKDHWISIPINHSSHVFNGKVIWLVKNGLNVNSNWFKMTDNSRMLIYAYNGASLNEFGGANGMKFNGLIYLNDHSSISLSVVGKNYYYGAIHVASKDASWQCNNSSLGAKLFLTFDQSILTEFISMGVLKCTLPSSSASETIVLSDLKIRSQLVGKVY